MYNKIKSSLVDESFFELFWGKVQGLVFGVIRKRIMKKTPVKGKKIVFMTYDNSYMCNPKYIAEEIIRRKLPYKLVWLVRNPVEQAKDFPCEIEVVKRASADAYFHMATSKIWVDNSINFFWKMVSKKKEQYLFETWHGSMGLKKVDKAGLEKRWLRSAKKYAKNTNYCISDSKFEDEVFDTTHWHGVPTLPYGHPRSDVLFLKEDTEKYQEIKKKVYDFFNSKAIEEKKDFRLEEGDKILLYAPTWRNDQDTDCFNIDFEKLLESLTERFGGNWKVLYRMHFHDRAKQPVFSSALKDRIIPATQYIDMLELMTITDAGITDYSSWAPDFLLTGKPLFIYATDIAKYNSKRGLYYDLETTPFPIARNNDELNERVRAFDEVKYAKEKEEFLERMGCYEDGHAAERVVDKFIEILDGKK